MFDVKRHSATILSFPFTFVIFAFFVVPLCLVVMVSFWDYNSYSIIPDFIFTNYQDIFYGCVKSLPDLCTSFATYISSLKFVFITWLITLLTGFLVALFLSFCVSSLQMQIVLFLLCTIPFWTSNVIRMISWIPLLGRNGLVNSTMQNIGLTDSPAEWLLYSEFSVILAFVHLYTLFMVVPIFNTMMRIDKLLLEAARDAGASGFQTLTNVIIPLTKPGIMIGSIFVVTLVMGDFITVRFMSGSQSANVGRLISNDVALLRYPSAAATSIILLMTVLIVIGIMLRFVNIRKEL